MSRERAAYDVLAEHVEPSIAVDYCCAEIALAAADAHDLAHGVHRIRIDEGTVERAANEAESVYERWGSWADVARSVLSAAVQEER